MNSDRRLEQELPHVLDELYLGPMPTYRDDLLHQTARTRQRPAWSFPGRWLPMVDVARQPVLAPRLPWRTIGLALLLLALLVAIVAAIAVGGRPKLPAPFGPARNGLVAYASGGDIYTVDPTVGRSTLIVGGPETDVTPRWSRDGTRLAFERLVAAGADSGFVYVAHADGSDPVRVTPEPLTVIGDVEFSPDGTQLLIPAKIAGAPGILIAATDGSDIHQLELGMPATNATWRPPDGHEILFMDEGDTFSGYGAIHLVSAEGGTVRTILEPTTGRYRGHPRWSPDGSLISFGEWRDADGLSVQAHVIRADGSGDRVLPGPPGTVWQAPYGWSNDGTRILVERGYTGGTTNARAAAIPVDGSGTGVEIAYSRLADPPSVTAWEWAPDDSSILGTPGNGSGEQALLDPLTGTSRTLPWESTSEPAWQRIAP